MVPCPRPSEVSGHGGSLEFPNNLVVTVAGRRLCLQHQLGRQLQLTRNAGMADDKLQVAAPGACVYKR